jgi:nitrogen regulatory protein PII
MQQIHVVIHPDCLGGVSEALLKAKIGPFRASDVTIFDPTTPSQGCYRGAKYAIGRACVKLELIALDHEVEAAVEAIQEGVDAFGKGHADLTILPIEDSLRLSPSPWTRSRAMP